jgi:HPt (histidine-containing phosphotransfer) domain-containing protein
MTRTGPPTMNDPSQLDANALDSLVQLNSQGDEGFLAGLVERYATLGDDSETELVAALKGGDRAAVRRIAHRLKGSSANLGLKAVADICHEIQTWADGTEDFTVIEEHLACLREARRTGTQALRDFVRNL